MINKIYKLKCYEKSTNLDWRYQFKSDVIFLSFLILFVEDYKEMWTFLTLDKSETYIYIGLFIVNIKQLQPFGTVTNISQVFIRYFYLLLSIYCLPCTGD